MSRSFTRKFALNCAVALSLLSFGASAQASTFTYFTSLSGSAVNPATPSLGTGTATVIFDDVTSFMTVSSVFSGLTGITTAAGLHCCVVAPGNDVFATPVPLPLFPLGVTSGSYSNTFDMAVASSFSSAFFTANGGTVSSALAALLAGLNAGQAYFSIHTRDFPGGEIRGFLEPVPIPAALPLFAAGLGAMGLMARRKKRKAAVAG